MDYLDLITDYPGWSKLAASRREQAKAVYEIIKDRAISHLREHKSGYITKGIGAAVGAGAGYATSKRWKGKPSIEQRAADAELKSIEKHKSDAEASGKKTGYASDAAHAFAKAHKHMSDFTAKYPARAGAVQGAAIGTGAATAIKHFIKKITE